MNHKDKPAKSDDTVNDLMDETFRQMQGELDEMETEHPNEYRDLASSVASLVETKQRAYGDAFGKSGDVLRILYPDGVRPEQYEDLLTITRVIDKLFRIATDRDALGESPWQDIIGYGLLALKRQQDKR
jgi:hypothetical protein